ncbi:hypothetical protein SteCoe_8798 [Stentor coeruleus]|uniref:Uncharacterized protein n=1 Tax=Stentor coeruleus TaxID=5963 RepID=A0A1R2CJ89_9CILI|nr:hypothetical protein SteCoe_8798 [Stentor coeruleus]
MSSEKIQEESKAPAKYMINVFPSVSVSIDQDFIQSVQRKDENALSIANCNPPKNCNKPAKEKAFYGRQKMKHTKITSAPEGPTRLLPISNLENKISPLQADAELKKLKEKFHKGSKTSCSCVIA